MIVIEANEKKCIDLGRRGESCARKIVFDITGWAELYGQGKAHVVAQRALDLEPYPVDVTQDDTKVSWVVTTVDNDHPGYGQCELVYITDGSVAKSVLYQTHTDISLSDPISPPDSPSVYGDLSRQIGDLSKLQTEDKSSLVSAINETKGLSAVLYTPQKLSEQQQLQARHNIGLSVDTLYVDIDVTGGLSFPTYSPAEVWERVNNGADVVLRTYAIMSGRQVVRHYRIVDKLSSDIRFASACNGMWHTIVIAATGAVTQEDYTIDTSGFVTEQELEEALANLSISPEVNLSEYAKVEYVDNAIKSALNQNVFMVEFSENGVPSFVDDVEVGTVIQIAMSDPDTVLVAETDSGELRFYRLTSITVGDETSATFVYTHHTIRDVITLWDDDIISIGRYTGEASALEIGAIPSPITAEVGNTVVVSEIDENGYPIKWKSVDLPVDAINGVVSMLNHQHYLDITSDGVVSLKPDYRGTGDASYPYSVGNGSLLELPDSFVIPDEVNGIKVSALAPGMFYGNTRLKEVTIPKSVVEIPEYCFAYATNLRNIYNSEHIISIGDRGVSTTRIKRAIFPSLTHIEKRGLGFNGYLEVVDIGNNIDALPEKVFSHCSRLREVNGGMNVKSIGARAFLYTRCLKDLPLLANVNSVGEYAFFGSRISTSLNAGGDISDKAFPTVDNVTDFWTGVPFSPCQNRIVTKLSQEAPAWKTTPVITGDTRTIYYKSCSVFAIMHIHSAITGKHYSSPEQFVAEVKADTVLSKYYSSYANWTGNFDNAAEMLSDMGYKTEVYTDTLDANSYKALVDALRTGAYVYSQIGTTGGWGNNQFDGGHGVVIYGINELGEVCVLDSAITQEPYRETGFEPGIDVYTYTMPIQNMVGPSSNFVIVYPPNVEPSTDDSGDCIPTPTTAKVGQTIVVKAVDENGKPTEWGAADMASGGGSLTADDWVKIATVSFAKDNEVVQHIITTDENGNAFSYDEILIKVSSQDYGGNLKVWFNTETLVSTDFVTLKNFFAFGNSPVAIIKRLVDKQYYVLSSTSDMLIFTTASKFETTKGKIQLVSLSREVTTNKGTIVVYGRSYK